MMIRMKRKYDSRGLTLVELLVALMVMSIILSAVAALAFALSSVSDASDDTAAKQAQLRLATLRITELIRGSKLVCKPFANGIALWSEDSGDIDAINVTELVYIDCGLSRDHIRVYNSSDAGNPVITLSEIDAVGSAWWNGYYDSGSYTTLISECSNVQFYPALITPETKFVSISFNLQENGVVSTYQINARLGAWAGNLLNSGADAIVNDDD